MRAGALALTAALAGCDGAAGPGLADVSAATGVDIVHDAGFRDTYCFPETLGAGCALVDVDGDGDLDLYAVQGGVVPGGPADLPGAAPRPLNRLLLGDGAGRFEDATAASGAAAHGGHGMGVCAGDVDGDGAVDLFVTNFGPDALLVNDGGGEFTEVAAGTALADPRWTTACGFADLDLDGHLDLYVGAYVRASPRVFEPCVVDGVPDYCDVVLFQGEHDRAYRGDGRGGFADRTAAWGLAELRGKALGCALVDLDDDGDVDLYVANDGVQNNLFFNRGDGVLEDLSRASGTAYNQDGDPEAGMGVGLGDVNGDGLPDLHVTNFAGESNTLYINRGDGRFRDRTRVAGLAIASRTPLGFGTALVDLDRDGLLDLYVANGHVLRNRGARRELDPFRQPDLVFRGLAGGRFEVWDAGPAPGARSVGRGLAAGDLDGDGAQDLVLHGGGEPCRVLRNGLALPGSSGLRVVLRDRTGSNTSAVGARVRLALSDGSAQVRWIRSGTGYLSQDDLAACFGIPPGVSPRSVAVRWPGGGETEHGATGAVDGVLALSRP